MEDCFKHFSLTLNTKTMIIEITKLDSSIIEKFGYDTNKQQMLIEFSGGSQYLYKDVNEIVVTEFMDAESKGRYINEIKKQFEFDKVEVEPIGTTGQPSHLI